MKSDVKKLVFIALMVSASLMLHFMESMFPLLYFIVPGLKLGLANIIILILVYSAPIYYAFVVFFIRIMLSSFFGGGISVFLFSLVGGLLSFLVMKLFKEQNLMEMSIPFVSVLGAISFNFGQLLVASIMVDNFFVLTYIFIMGIASLATGLFIGFSAKFVIERKLIEKNIKFGK